jgi:hypothetical protein
VPEPALGSNVAPSSTVTASSENPADGQTATKAIDGVIDGYPGDYTAEWATQGGVAGSWLQLDWSAPVELTRLVLHDRPNEWDQVTGAMLTFSDGSSVTVPAALDNAGAAVKVDFPARSVSWVRITVTSVGQYTGSAGLSEVEAWTAPGSTAPAAASAAAPAATAPSVVEPVPATKGSVPEEVAVEETTTEPSTEPQDAGAADPSGAPAVG